MEEKPVTIDNLKEKIVELDKQIFGIEQSKRFLRAQIKVLRDAERRAEREKRIEKRATKVLTSIPVTVQDKIREKLLK